jgi:hypothetical protein
MTLDFVKMYGDSPLFRGQAEKQKEFRRQDKKRRKRHRLKITMKSRRKRKKYYQNHDKS